jgi:hypothetical protein
MAARGQQNPTRIQQLMGQNSQTQAIRLQQPILAVSDVGEPERRAQFVPSTGDAASQVEFGRV